VRVRRAEANSQTGVMSPTAHNVVRGDENNSVAVSAITDIAGSADSFASVEFNPEERFTASESGDVFRSIQPQRSGWSDNGSSDPLRRRAACDPSNTPRIPL
jgi:hypothetical protein